MYNRSLLFSVSHIVHLFFQMSFEWFVGFADGTNRHTCNMYSASWVIVEPHSIIVFDIKITHLNAYFIIFCVFYVMQIVI